MSRCYCGHARVLKYSLICKFIWPSTGRPFASSVVPRDENKTDDYDRPGAELRFDTIYKRRLLERWRWRRRRQRRKQGNSWELVKTVWIDGYIKARQRKNGENIGRRLTILSDAFEISHSPPCLYVYFPCAGLLWLIYSSNGTTDRWFHCRHFCHALGILFQSRSMTLSKLI